MSALTHDILAKLEAQQRGKLSEEETHKLAKELDRLPGGAEAAADYRRLWASLAALQGEEQRTRMTAWEEEWQSSDDAELAEWHASGNLSVENQDWVNERRKKDQDFSELLQQQEDIVAGMGALKGEQFREQMNQWGQNEQASTAQIRPLRSNWRRFAAVAAAVLLLIVAGVSWNARSNYTDTALADKYYKLPPTGNLMGGGEVLEEAAYMDAFTEAHGAMQAKDYDRARLLLEQLITEVPPASFSGDDLKYYQDNLDWNLILALLGQEESGRPLQQRLDVILASPNHIYFADAQRLQRDLNKFWR